MEVRDLFEEIWYLQKMTWVSFLPTLIESLGAWLDM